MVWDGSREEGFLLKARAMAREAGHIWPEYAACEAALESSWGRSELAVRANNLFGQKQSHIPLPGSGTLALPTREFLHGAWTSVVAKWASFPDWAACFKARMELLHRMAKQYPGYGRALIATAGDEYVREVSAVWSTDPKRAEQVLQIHKQHQSQLLAA